MVKKMSYAEQLRHPEWQKKRLEVLQWADWTCLECGTKEITLHVHHRHYVKGRMAWEYEPGELTVLCEDCHEEEHVMAKELELLLASTNTTTTLALLRGFYNDDDGLDPWIGDMGRDRDQDTWGIGLIAMLLKHVHPNKYRKIAEFVVSLSHESSEARPLFDKYEDVFDRLP